MTLGSAGSYSAPTFKVVIDGGYTHHDVDLLQPYTVDLYIVYDEEFVGIGSTRMPPNSDLLTAKHTCSWHQVTCDPNGESFTTQITRKKGGATKLMWFAFDRKQGEGTSGTFELQ